MDAIEALMSEHRLIERALDSLVAFADEAVRKTTDDKEELARFVAFIREFADAYHHGKEEDILFTAMVQAGFSRQSGPVAVMLWEHDQGRAHVRVLAELAAQAGAWTAEDRRRIAEHANAFAALLRQHIHKEDAILYPMAEQRLPRAVMALVCLDCEAYERRKSGSGEHDRLRRLAEELTSRHALLAREEPDAPACGHACGS